MSQLTRDYKSPGRRPLQPHGMKAFALGVLAGALLAGGIAALVVVHWRRRQAALSPACASTNNAKATRDAAAGSGPAAAPPARHHETVATDSSAPAAAQASAPAAQHYDFYRMLPRLTVPVPANTASAPAHRLAVPAGSPHYLVQVGSYTSHAEAQQVRDRLARLGIGAHIQRVTENGRVLNRVRVGPVDAAGLHRLRHELAAAGMHPLVIPTGGE